MRIGSHLTFCGMATKRKFMRHCIFSLLLMLFLIYPIQSQSADIVYKVKGLTAQDRAQWEKDNIKELTRIGYFDYNDSRRHDIFKDGMFINKFKDNPEYNALEAMSREQRDSLFYNAPADVSIDEIQGNQNITHKFNLTMMYLEYTDFYSKSFLILICGIVFIMVLKTLARRTSQQELSFSKKQKVTGSILMLIGAFSILLSIIMFISSSYPENELTKYGYELSNRYNDSIIRPSDANLIWGYNTPFLSGIFSTLYGGICLLGWGIYVRNYQKSIIPLWKKVCKVIGYVLLTASFWSCSEFHYFDIWEFIPKLIILSLSILLIKIGYEKRAANKQEAVSLSNDRPQKRHKDIWSNYRKGRILWINKRAYNLYKYIEVAIIVGIILGLIILCDSELGIFIILETLVKNGLILLYLRNKATQEYSEDYLVPQWFKGRFYKYLNNRAELRIILLFLYMPLFYVIPLPFGTYAIVFYIIPICLLIGAYISFKWIMSGRNESL